MNSTFAFCMADVFEPRKRSEIMSHIKSKHTSPEVEVRKVLNNLGFRFRMHVANLPGKPDFANKTKKIAIFANGCFWHQHKNCSRSSIPKSNKEYWLPKLERNVEKQKKDIKKLHDLGFTVILVWECETKNNSELNRKLSRKLWEN